MKHYIVYDTFGSEVWYKPNQQYVKAGSHNAAEIKARKVWAGATVCYTEI